jgi:hypothetical protein
LFLVVSRAPTVVICIIHITVANCCGPNGYNCLCMLSVF